jgi:hypothetical protein
MAADDETLLSVEQLSARYAVQPATVREWLRTGRLRGRRLGRDWRVSWNAAFAFEGAAPVNGTPRAIALARRPLLTPSEVARRYGCSVATVLRWHKTGSLPGCVLTEKAIRFRRDRLGDMPISGRRSAHRQDVNETDETYGKPTFHDLRKVTLR